MDEYVSEGKRKYVPLFSSFFYHTSTPLQSNTLARRSPTSSRMSASVLFLSPTFLIPLAEEAEEAADSAAISEVPPSAELRTLKEAEESLYKAEHLLTEHDLQIVALDLPERMQLIDSTPLSLYSPSHTQTSARWTGWRRSRRAAGGFSASCRSAAWCSWTSTSRSRRRTRSRRCCGCTARSIWSPRTS